LKIIAENMVREGGQ